MGKSEQGTVSLEPSVAFYSLNRPVIPKPSPHLQQLLDEFEPFVFPKKPAYRVNSTGDMNSASSTRHRINGFIAFRSFYSKSIRPAASQREISRRLAVIWKTEKSKDSWRRIALQYNNSGSPLGIAAWICLESGSDAAIPFKDDRTDQYQEPKRQITKFNRLSSTCIIEDIFVENSYFDLTCHTEIGVNVDPLLFYT
ncbi:unnamed protein product [Kuraishia capsulata CBS 1993]|uniref:Alpha box domain-containing protein n=1 Tax=Kuraishia capsulata CBS 1993 TaxID=1382522 RepID=W6MHM6_9ASCO|nr:uncharacterized protein KUCA_T00001759001 [Kuraishia capsulata CBS 1993]CDK25789.1 unnamed protein product [Kuraishia capsulata CBS 1993]